MLSISKIHNESRVLILCILSKEREEKMSEESSILLNRRTSDETEKSNLFELPSPLLYAIIIMLWDGYCSTRKAAMLARLFGTKVSFQGLKTIGSDMFCSFSKFYQLNHRLNIINWRH